MSNCHHSRFLAFVVIMVATFFLCHCGKKYYRYPDRFDVPPNDEVRTVLHSLLAENSQVSGIKGIGNIQWRHKDTLQKSRAAWIGNMPDRFRLELLGPTGQPLASLASDGIWNYLLLHTEDRFLKRRASQDDLKRLLSIRVSTKDLVHFLCGRLPIEAGGTGWLERNPTDHIQKLIYKEKTQRFFYQIYYDEVAKKTLKVERMNEKGELIVRATFHNTILQNGHTVPKAITITSGLDAMFNMKIDKMWINPSVNADKFELAPKN